MIGWRFPILDGGNEQGFNNSGIETFNGEDVYENLAREICQNSLDAKDPEKEEPVEVRFEVFDTSISDYTEISSLLDVIDKCEDYWRGRADSKLNIFFNEIRSLKWLQELAVLKISDYNTCGLTGARANKHEKSAWRALVHSDGVSEKGDTSGGSYGIGKNAPFACSRLRTVFYNTYAVDGVKAFQGTARLMTHQNEDGQDTVGIGNFVNSETNGPVFEHDECAFRDLFPRNQYGTDVIIVGFNKYDDWQSIIEKAIVKNFFVSIYESKLVVYVGDRLINKERIDEIIRKYIVGDKEMLAVKELYEALSYSDHRVEITSIMEENDTELFIRIDEGYNRRIAETRNSGMVVVSKTKKASKAYSAVLIARGKELNKVLKSTEPPRHDKWDPGIIQDVNERGRAKSIKRKMDDWMNTTIDEVCKSDAGREIDPDGMSQFLPDDLNDGNKRNKKSSEAIEADTKVQKIIGRKIVSTNEQTVGKMEEGIKDDGSVNNTASGGDGEGEIPVSGEPSGKDRVGVPADGPKNIKHPVVLNSRIFKIPGKRNRYMASITLEDTCTDVFLSVHSLGDDGGFDKVSLCSYIYDGEVYMVENDLIGPLSFKSNVAKKIEVELKNDEKMLLKLDIRQR